MKNHSVLRFQTIKQAKQKQSQAIHRVYRKCSKHSELPSDTTHRHKWGMRSYWLSRSSHCSVWTLGGCDNTCSRWDSSDRSSSDDPGDRIRFCYAVADSVGQLMPQRTSHNLWSGNTLVDIQGSLCHRWQLRTTCKRRNESVHWSETVDVRVVKRMCCT